jgi:acetoacetyl-CoA synthetase
VKKNPPLTRPPGGKPLWTPSKAWVQGTLLTKFQKQLGCSSFEDLHTLSISSPDLFWETFWDFAPILASKKGTKITEGSGIRNTRFFPEARLNYAENLLRRRDNAIAISFYSETKEERHLSYAELYAQTSKFAQYLQSLGIRIHDRVAGYMPNLPETVVAMLATTSFGAIWSSSSPDFGTKGLIDRFSQITPKALIMADGYHYNGKVINCLERLPDILEAIPSIEHVVVVPYLGLEAHHFIESSYTLWHTCLEEEDERPIQFEHLPFDHPLCILYSSGTTGMPKCIIHTTGGALLQHMKEHQLHCNIQKDDVVFYFTTCGWMMWNWLVSCLACQARIVLFEGAPLYQDSGLLFHMAEKFGVTFFGTSAKYLSTLQKEKFKTNELKDLRAIGSTGSPLAPDTFEYVYKNVKKNVQLISLSGGTDIISCFMLGNPNGPVWAGQLQAPGLGMDVQVFNENGQPTVNEAGELVCLSAFPSRPLGFWNDTNQEKYTQAYFETFPGVWHHGDFVEKTPEGGFIVLGRSDSVLNPGGVRIGTAEIYNQVEQLDFVTECVAVGRKKDNDEEIILCVVLKNNIDLDEEKQQAIKNQIRKNTTPRHVPAHIIQVSDLPKTKNGKLAEGAVRNCINGLPVKNISVLANPQCLEQFEKI